MGVDMSAHQNLCQICRGEGDLLVHRLAGADLSDQNPLFILGDVAQVFDVFQNLTFELAKMNLKGLAGKGLGRLMGAVTWQRPAGGDGDPVKHIDPNLELVYYDSTKAKRTWLGYCCNADCCFPPIYKVTSERVLYTEWDWWYLCDNPAASCCCGFYICRAAAADCCCMQGGATERIAKARKADEKEAAREPRSRLSRFCAVPIGRTVSFFDMDIVVDIGAHQNCRQLPFNEGDLQIYRLAGGDIDSNDTLFTVKNMPEVFSNFDDLSYTLSMMDLSHYRQSAVGAKMQDVRPFAAP